MGTHVRNVIETKVKASTAGTFLVSAAIAVLNQTAGDDSLMGSLPAWAQTLVLLVVPPAVTFLSGWQARHTPRTDVPAVSPVAPLKGE